MSPVHSAADVDELLDKVDAEVSKVNEYQSKVVKLRSCEANLLELYEKTRLMIHDFLKNPNRDHLIEVFGGDCRRIARLLVALEYNFSPMYVDDPRKASCQNTCASLESVLNDKGFCSAIREAKELEEISQSNGHNVFHDNNMSKANLIIAQLGCDHAEMVPITRLPPVAWNASSKEAEQLEDGGRGHPESAQATIPEQHPSTAEPGLSTDAGPGQLVPGVVAGNPALPPSRDGEGTSVSESELAQPGQSTVTQPSGGGYGGKDVPLVQSPYLTEPGLPSVPGGPVPHQALEQTPHAYTPQPGLTSLPGGPVPHQGPMVGQAPQAYTAHAGLSSVPGSSVPYQRPMVGQEPQAYTPSTGLPSGPGGPAPQPNLSSAQPFPTGGPALPRRTDLNLQPSSHTATSGPAQPQRLHVGADVAKPIRRERTRASVLLNSGDARGVAEKTFAEVAATHGQNSRLIWNNRGIPTFLTKAFQTLGLEPPPERAMYAAYTNFDRDASWSLDIEECTTMFEKIMVSLYGFGVSDPHRKIVEHIKSGELGRVAMNVFQEIDVSKCGSLRWNDGQIRQYILRVLEHFNLPRPSESNMYAVFHTYDSDMNQSLNMYESRALVETLCRANYSKASDDLVMCRQGHEMALFTAQKAGANCQVCGAAIQAPVLFWHCAPCNFIECVSCSKKNRG